MKSHFISLMIFISFSGLLLGAFNPGFAQENTTPVEKPSPKSLFVEKKYAELINTYGQLVDSMSAQDMLFLAQSYSETGNSVLYIKVLNMVMAKKPKDVASRTLLGREYIKTGKNKEALNILKEALELDPKFEAAYLATAEYYEKQKNKYELRMLYQDMLEKLGPKPQYYSKLCEYCSSDSIYDQAKSFCSQAIKLDSKEPKNYVYLGHSYRDTGDSSLAEKYLKQAADSFKTSDFANMSFGQFLEEQKNFPEAYRYYKRAVIANPQNAKAWVSFAFMALELQKFAESIEGFRRACKKDKTLQIEFRKATNAIRLTKQTVWLRKFEAEVDRCPP